MKKFKYRGTCKGPTTKRELKNVGADKNQDEIELWGKEVRRKEPGHSPCTCRVLQGNESLVYSEF